MHLSHVVGFGKAVFGLEQVVKWVSGWRWMGKGEEEGTSSGKTKIHNCTQFSWSSVLCTIVGKIFSILLNGK